MTEQLSRTKMLSTYFIIIISFFVSVKELDSEKYEWADGKKILKEKTCIENDLSYEAIDIIHPTAFSKCENLIKISLNERQSIN